MKELTPEQRAEAHLLAHAHDGSVEAKYVEALRIRHPKLSDAELRLLCTFTDDLIKVIDQQRDAIAERDGLLKKSYASLDTYKVWAWGATALAIVLEIMFVFDLRLL